MLEIIIVGFIFWMGYQVGMSVTAYRLRDLIYREAKRRGLIKEIDLNFEEEELTVMQLFVEKANNTLYLYEKDDNTFVCQGSTPEELATLAKKYKNIKYASVIIDKEIYAFVDGVVKSEKEVLR
jgi:sporulation protein YlmC with PRC-barrel domain